MAVIVMPMSRVAPRLVERFGQRGVMTTGLVWLAVGLGLLSRLDAGFSYRDFLVGLLAFGVGMALTSTPATTAIVTSLPRAKQGVASAMNDVSRELGSALGIAILGSLFSSGYRSGVSTATGDLAPATAEAVERSAGAGFAAASQLGADGQQLADAVGDAFASGLSSAMVAGAAIAVLAAGFTIWRAPARPAPADLDRIELDPATAVVARERLPELVG